MWWRRRPRVGLWDVEIDGAVSKRDGPGPTGKISARSRVKIFVQAMCLALILLGTLLVVVGAIDFIRFGQSIASVNQRASRLGGGVTNGRREYREHVTVWFHGKEIDDRAMPEILSIVRECVARGFDDPSLSLDLDGTDIGDEGIRYLHDIAGLDSIWLSDTRVTDRGIMALRASLPNTAIHVRASLRPAERR